MGAEKRGGQCEIEGAEDPGDRPEYGTLLGIALLENIRYIGVDLEYTINCLLYTSDAADDQWRV